MIARFDNVMVPIETGQNEAYQTDLTRPVRIGGTLLQPRFNFLCGARSLFMKKRIREIVLTPQEISEFFSLIQRSPDSDCWLWTGPKNGKSNYGLFYGKLSHRVMFTIVFGPTAKNVLHNCDNPPCVSPFHIKAGSQADNMKDVAIRLRGKRGIQRKNAKLTDEKVRALRQFYRDNSGPYRIFKYRLQEHLKVLGINITTAHRAATGRTWRHVENPYKITGYTWKTRKLKL